MLHLADLGFKQISIEPVVAAEDEEYHLSTDDLPEINQHRTGWRRLTLNGENRGEAFYFFHFMVDLSRALCSQTYIGLWSRH